MVASSVYRWCVDGPLQVGIGQEGSPGGITLCHSFMGNFSLVGMRVGMLHFSWDHDNWGFSIMTGADRSLGLWNRPQGEHSSRFLPQLLVLSRLLKERQERHPSFRLTLRYYRAYMQS